MMFEHLLTNTFTNTFASSFRNTFTVIQRCRNGARLTREIPRHESEPLSIEDGVRKGACKDVRKRSSAIYYLCIDYLFTIYLFIQLFIYCFLISWAQYIYIDRQLMYRTSILVNIIINIIIHILI